MKRLALALTVVAASSLTASAHPVEARTAFYASDSAAASVVELVREGQPAGYLAFFVQADGATVESSGHVAGARVDAFMEGVSAAAEPASIDIDPALGGHVRFDLHGREVDLRFTPYGPPLAQLGRGLGYGQWWNDPDPHSYVMCARVIRARAMTIEGTVGDLTVVSPARAYIGSLRAQVHRDLDGSCLP